MSTKNIKNHIIDPNKIPYVEEVPQFLSRDNEIANHSKKRKLDYISKKKPAPYAYITTRDQLKKLLKDCHSIPYGNTPDNVRKLLKYDENGQLFDSDFRIKNGQLKLRNCEHKV